MSMSRSPRKRTAVLTLAALAAALLGGVAAAQGLVILRASNMHGVMPGAAAAVLVSCINDRQQPRAMIPTASVFTDGMGRQLLQLSCPP